MNLITDRTEADVDRLKRLTAKINNGTASLEDYEKYRVALTRGNYGIDSINRVVAAMNTINAHLNSLGYIVNGYTPFGHISDNIPPSVANKYIGNIKALRDTLAVIEDTPKVPNDMEQLTYQEANAIEQILLDVDGLIDLLESVFIRSGVHQSGCVGYFPDQALHWSIIKIPELISNPVYTGQEMSPVFANVENTIVDAVAVDSGKYIAKIKPNHGYKWPDESTAAKEFSWEILKAQGVVSAPDKLVMTKENWQDSITIEYNGDGNLEVSKDNGNVFMRVDGNRIYLSSFAIGETRLSITATEGRNYKAAAPAVCVVTIADIIQADPTSGVYNSGNTLYLPDIYR